MSTTIPPVSSVGATTRADNNLTSAADQQDRFMKLLVAQMRNQDPLNPMDNAQMTSQVAQINTVSGIEKLNATVQSLLQAFTGLQSSQAAMDLPGRQVLVDGNTLLLADGAASGGVQLAGKADQVQVDVVDAAGRVVQTIPFGAAEAGVRSFRWDGRLADGSTAPEGAYRMRATATLQGKAVSAATLTGGTVHSVSTTGGQTQVDLGPLGIVPASSIQTYL